MYANLWSSTLSGRYNEYVNLVRLVGFSMNEAVDDVFWSSGLTCTRSHALSQPLIMRHLYEYQRIVFNKIIYLSRPFQLDLE